MKLTKRSVARQKNLVNALRKGIPLGGILAGFAALAPVAGCEVVGCKSDEARQPTATNREMKSSKGDLLLSNHVREGRGRMVSIMGVAPKK